MTLGRHSFSGNYKLATKDESDNQPGDHSLFEAERGTCWWQGTLQWLREECFIDI